MMTPLAAAPAQTLITFAGNTTAAQNRIKTGLWCYLALVLFEGALRKWILPGLSAPLLVVRDPLALWLLLYSWQKGLLLFNWHVRMYILISIAALYLAVFVGHGSFTVALYGARILALHAPLIFLFGQVFNESDVIRAGRRLLWLSIPMTILIALQFYSPQSAWVNRGVGGDVNGSGFDGIGGYFRPSGFFSFTNGVTLFYSLVACFILFFWQSSSKCNKALLAGATTCLIAAIPLSISRGLFFSVIVSLGFATIAILTKPKKILGAMGIAVLLALVFLWLWTVPVFHTAAEVFLTRFDTANEQEGGLNSMFLDRYLGGLWSALQQSGNLPYFGLGIGLGTNAGSMAFFGSRLFLISEGEWGRIVGELGPLMGLGVIFLRLAFCLQTCSSSIRKLKQNDCLSWMLLSFGLLNIPQGNWAQPTSLGFCIVGGGLLLAATKPGQRHSS